MGGGHLKDPTEAFFEAALDLLSESGELSELRIREICERAGRPRSLFYGYYPRLEGFRHDLLSWVVSRIEADIFADDEGDEGSEDDVLDLVARLARGLGVGSRSAAYFMALARLQSDPQLQELHARLMARVIGRLEDAIRQAQAERRVRDDLDPHDCAMTVALLGVGQALWQSAGVNMDMSRLAPALAQLIGPGLSLDRGADSA